MGYIILQVVNHPFGSEIGKSYIEIDLPDTAGKELALSSLIGPGKWVLVDFWATWYQYFETIRDFYGSYDYGRIYD